VLSLILIAAIGIAGDTSVISTDSIRVDSGQVRRAIPAPLDTVRRRKAVDLSDAYYQRLTIHRWASYAELPLFAAEYVVGDKLMARGTPIANWVKPTHLGLAVAISGLFGLNTLTGGWNLVEGWSQFGDNRKLVVAHTALMLVADGGFAGASLLVHRRLTAERTHRAVAVASMSAATVSTVMMWIAKNK
jgi:hypothetical protein